MFNKLEKRDKMQGLPSIVLLFHNKFNKLNKTGAQILDFSYHRKLKVLQNCFFGMKTSIIFYHFECNIVMDVIT